MKAIKITSDLKFNNDSMFPEKLMDDYIRSLNKIRDDLVMQRLEKFEISDDFERDKTRRFKKFIREVAGREESLYYNDGSLNGLRVITFVTEQSTDLNPGTYRVEYVIRYY